MTKYRSPKLIEYFAKENIIAWFKRKKFSKKVLKTIGLLRSALKGAEYFAQMSIRVLHFEIVIISLSVTNFQFTICEHK